MSHTYSIDYSYQYKGFINTRLMEYYAGTTSVIEAHPLESSSQSEKDFHKTMNV